MRMRMWHVPTWMSFAMMSSVRPVSSSVSPAVPAVMPAASAVHFLMHSAMSPTVASSMRAAVVSTMHHTVSSVRPAMPDSTRIPNATHLWMSSPGVLTHLGIWLLTAVEAVTKVSEEDESDHEDAADDGDPDDERGQEVGCLVGVAGCEGVVCCRKDVVDCQTGGHVWYILCWE